MQQAQFDVDYKGIYYHVHVLHAEDDDGQVTYQTIVQDVDGRFLYVSPISYFGEQSAIEHALRFIFADGGPLFPVIATEGGVSAGFDSQAEALLSSA